MSPAEGGLFPNEPRRGLPREPYAPADYIDHLQRLMRYDRIGAAARLERQPSQIADVRATRVLGGYAFLAQLAPPGRTVRIIVTESSSQGARVSADCSRGCFQHKFCEHAAMLAYYLETNRKRIPLVADEHAGTTLAARQSDAQVARAPAVLTSPAPVQIAAPVAPAIVPARDRWIKEIAARRHAVDAASKQRARSGQVRFLFDFRRDNANKEFFSRPRVRPVFLPQGADPRETIDIDVSSATTCTLTHATTAERGLVRQLAAFDPMLGTSQQHRSLALDIGAHFEWMREAIASGSAVTRQPPYDVMVPMSLREGVVSPDFVWEEQRTGKLTLTSPYLRKGFLPMDLHGSTAILERATGIITELDIETDLFAALANLPAIPLKDVAAFSERWRATPALKAIPAPGESALKILRVAPGARATLAAARIPHVSGDGREHQVLRLQLNFTYGALTADPCDLAQYVVDPNKPLMRYLRDANAEARVRAAIERGLSAREYKFGDESRAYVLAWKDNVREHVLSIMHFLERDGVAVELDPNLGVVIEEADDVAYGTAEIGSGGGWFDLDVGVSVGGQKVSLVPLLEQVLGNPSIKLDDVAAELPAGGKATLTLQDGRVLRVKHEQLRQLFGPLYEWLNVTQARRSGRIRLPRAAATALREEAVIWTGAEHLRRLRETIARVEAVPATPPGFRGELRPYQSEGVRWLNTLAECGLGGVLADDMGLGKTVQVLAHAAMRKHAGISRHPVMVVAPTSLSFNWVDEAKKFAPGLKVLQFTGPDRMQHLPHLQEYDLIITTFGLMRSDSKRLLDQRFDLIVFDEAQALKNEKSLSAKAARELKADRVIVVTGTPLENHLGELWALVDLALPGLLGESPVFRKRFRNPIEREGLAKVRRILNERIGPFILRRTKEGVARELPAKTEIEQSIELGPKQRALYESLRIAMHDKVRELIGQKGLAQSGIEVIDALLKLRQVCCDPKLVKLEQARSVDESAKLEHLVTILPELVADGRKVLVFSQFTSMLDLIQEKLVEHSIAFARLDGDTSPTDRRNEVARFQEGKVPVFLLSLKAGGVGLNLTAADTVILYDPWWNPQVENQAIDRAHRIGQDKPVFVYKLRCVDTVEDRILDLQRRKAELARAVLEGGTTTGARFDHADIDHLFGA